VPIVVDVEEINHVGSYADDHESAHGRGMVRRPALAYGTRL
jgi:hypothetical protein